MLRKLLAAEWLKARTTRTSWLLAVTLVVVVVGAAAAAAAGSTFSPTDHPARQVLATAGVTATAALLVGVLAITTEIRHGTLTTVLLVTPRRTPVFVAKLASASVEGAGLGLISFGAAAAVALPVLSARHVPSQLDLAGVAEIIVGGATSAGLFAALGVGLGAVVRNQVGAVVAALGLVYAVFPVLGAMPGIGSSVQRFGLDGLFSAAAGTANFLGSTHLLSAGVALGVLASYVFVLSAAGSASFRSRDLRE